jgi:hypothetical protein
MLKNNFCKILNILKEYTQQVKFFYEGKNEENFGIVDVKIGKYEIIKFESNGKTHIEQLK